MIITTNHRTSQAGTIKDKSFRKKCRNIAKWLRNIENNETLSLLNIFVTSVLVGLNMTPSVSKAASILSVSAAVIQIGIITTYHGYMYFPIPKGIKDKWRNFRESQRERRNKAFENLNKKANKAGNAVNQIEDFPFWNIHVLKAGVPCESGQDNTEEDETPFSHEESEFEEEQ